MLMTNHADGTSVSTPIYIGTDMDVAKMIRCVHDYQETGKAVKTTDAIFATQKCSKCGAIRWRGFKTQQPKEQK